MPTFIETEIQSSHYNKIKDPGRKIKCTEYFSRVRSLKFLGLLLLMLLVISLPFILYVCIYDNGDFTRNNQFKCSVDKIYRLPCGKENISKTECLDIFCCFETYTNSCYHSEPSNYYYYLDKRGNYVPSQNNSPLGLQNLPKLAINVEEDQQTLKIILDTSESGSNKLPDETSNFDILKNEDNKLSVTVYRKGTKEILLTTSKGPLTATSEFLDWTFQMTNTTGVLFGLGELNIDLDENSTFTKIIYKNQRDHNTLPVFMAYNNEKYHAVVVHHEGALQITVLPSYLIFLRNIAGEKIEIDLVDGPYPEDIYTKLRAKWGKDKLIPEWLLGVHLCREEPAENLNSLLEQYNTFVTNRKTFPKFTYESDCIHDDILLHLLAENYTAPQIVEMFTKLDLKEKFVMSYPPQIPINSIIFEQYKDSSIFYKNDTTGEIYIGKYKGFEVVFPNYRHKGIVDFLQNIQEMFENIEIAGFTFTHSWPQDESYEMGNTTQPYINKIIQDAFSYTLPWDLTEENDLHLKFHNLYGPDFRQIVQEKFTNVPEFSFSSVSDIDNYEPLVIQNQNTSWTNLKESLRTSLFNSIFGHSLISVPVCGSNEFYDKELNEDLCLRWYLVAATMPLVRISSEGVPRDPTNLNTKYTSNKVIDILEIRKSLIPYYRGIINGNKPLIRPMFYNFPEDDDVHSLDEQYMIGDAILVAQPMSPDIQEMKIYLPPNMNWYELWGGIKYRQKKGAQKIRFPIFKNDWVSFIKEGNIVPRVSETQSGEWQISLTAAMDCRKACEASGSLLFHFPDEDLDVSVKFTALNETISVETIEDKYEIIKGMLKSVCFYADTVCCCDINKTQDCHKIFDHSSSK